MAVFNPRIPARLPPRVEFLNDGFRGMLINNGMDVVWEQSHECPCLILDNEQVDLGLGDAFAPAVVSPKIPATKQARPNCPECSGKGYVWKSPQTIKAYVSREKVTELEADWTSVTPKAGRRIRTKDKELLNSGELKFTVLAEHRPSIGDRYRLVDNVQIRKETHFYLGEAKSELRYDIYTVELDTDPVQDRGVTYCYTVDSDLDVAQSGTEKFPGVDFTVELDGSGITWINPPEVNGRYTITYYGTPKYLVTELPFSFRDHYQKFKRAEDTLIRDVVHSVGKMEFLVTGETTGGNG